MEEEIFADPRDVEIGKPILVVVGGRDSHRKAEMADAGGLGHVAETEVTFVAVDPARVPGAAIGGRLEGPTEEEDVGAAVAVVVEEGKAGGHRLGEIPSARRPGMMDEIDPAAGALIGKQNPP
jgi:hypothetical protein